MLGSWRGRRREYNGNQDNLAIGNLASLVLTVSPLLSPAGEWALRKTLGTFHIEAIIRDSYEILFKIKLLVQQSYARNTPRARFTLT